MDIYETVLSDVGKRTINPVYIFSGEEEYLKRELEQKIKVFLIDPSSEFFNYEVLDGRECDAGSLIIKCRTIPFFSSMKLVVVRNADEICSSDELREYIQNPLPATCLILMVEKSIPSSLKKYEVKLDKLDSRKRAEWIRKKVGEFKKGIAFEAIQLLRELAGDDLGRLSHEIEKLVLFVGEKPSISKEDVQNIHPSGSQEMNIFNFVDALGNRDKKQALRILKDLILSEDIGRILGMIARQFRLILQSKELSKKGYSQTRIAQEIEIRQSWLVGKVLGQARNFSSEALAKKFETLVNAELDIKTNRIHRMQPLFSLEILVSKLCS